jgi:cytochrome c oxidase assembly protein subunit 11
MSVVTQNRVLVGKLLLLVGLMLGFCFAMVPFYRKICEVAGINDSRDVNYALANSQVDSARTVTLELVAATNQNMPITFEPVEKAIQVHLGQVSQIRYRVVNNTDRVMIAQAVPSYSPAAAANYLTKLQCFCFNNQTLQPHETREMPVVFVLSRELPEGLDRVTLAYTFFDITAEQNLAPQSGKQG